jgi:hypothetical protein
MPAGPFAWRTRTDARAAVWRSAPDCDYVEGTHDAWLPARHVRAILSLPGIGWWIVDHLLGTGEHAIDVFWHLHPAWHVSASGAAVQLVHRDGTEVAMASTLPLRHAIDTRLAAWSPAYGRVEPAPVLQVHARAILPLSLATFIAAPAAAKGLRMEDVELVSAPPGALARAWRATGTGAAVTLLAAVPADYPGQAAPSHPWGTDRIRTRARVTALVESSAPNRAAQLLTIDEGGCGIARRGVPAGLASGVHEPVRAELGTH